MLKSSLSSEMFPRSHGCICVCACVVCVCTCVMCVVWGVALHIFSGWLLTFTSLLSGHSLKEVSPISLCKLGCFHSTVSLHLSSLHSVRLLYLFLCSLAPLLDYTYPAASDCVTPVHGCIFSTNDSTSHKVGLN